MSKEDGIVTPTESNEISMEEALPGTATNLRDSFADFTPDADVPQETPTEGSEGDDTLNGDDTKPTETKADGTTDETFKSDGEAAREADVKAAADKAAAERKPEPDAFDDIKLPAHANPKTGKQFEEVKRMGREMVKAAREEAAKLRAEVETFKKQLAEAPQGGGELPEEVASELEKSRALIRVFAFKDSQDYAERFTKPIAKHTETVWSALKGIGYGDEDIAKAKTLGINGVDWNKAVIGADERKKAVLFGALAQLDQLEQEEKEASEAAAKDKEAFIERMKSAPDKAKVERDTGIEIASKHLEGMKFFDAIDPKNPPEDAKHLPPEYIEAYNLGGARAKEFIEKAKSGELSMQDIIAVGAASQRYLVINDAVNKRANTLDTQVKELTKQLAERDTLIANARKAGGAFKQNLPPPVETEDDANLSLEDRWKKFGGGEG